MHAEAMRIQIRPGAPCDDFAQLLRCSGGPAIYMVCAAVAGVCAYKAYGLFRALWALLTAIYACHQLLIVATDTATFSKVVESRNAMSAHVLITSQPRRMSSFQHGAVRFHRGHMLLSVSCQLRAEATASNETLAATWV